ncbi:MAG: hypothetical protein ACRYFX_05715 [Janthinobacterium lividum]
MNTPACTPLSRSTDPDWRSLLRESVRLHLHLGEQPPELAQELATHLQRTEQELLDYLLAGDPAPAHTQQQALALVEQAQLELLGSPLEMRELQGEPLPTLAG